MGLNTGKGYKFVPKLIMLYDYVSILKLLRKFRLLQNSCFSDVSVFFMKFSASNMIYKVKLPAFLNYLLAGPTAPNFQSGPKITMISTS